MSKKSKRKITLGQIIIFAIYFIGGIAIGHFVTANLIPFAEVYTLLDNFFVYIACIYIILFVSMVFGVIIHEAGHLVFGLLTGYKFVSFRIFSFMWIKIDGKLRLKRFSLAGTGGQCLMSHPGNIGEPISVTLYNLGGSIMNILVAALLFAVSFMLGELVLLVTFLRALAAMCVAFGLANGVPLKLGTMNNDGYNAFSLRKNAAARRSFWLQLKVNELNSKGVRLKDMPDSWFTLPSGDELQNSMSATVGVLAANRLMDLHRFQEADNLMSEYVNGDNAIVDVHKNLMICDRIYCELVGENRGEVIDAMLTKETEQFMKAMKKSLTVARTLYLYSLLSERNIENADKYKKQFEKIARKYPHPADVDSERELINIALNKENEICQ